jgi:hypothetical protein
MCIAGAHSFATGGIEEYFLASDICEGYLELQSKKNLSVWKKRWCTLMVTFNDVIVYKRLLSNGEYKQTGW